MSEEFPDGAGRWVSLGPSPLSRRWCFAAAAACAVIAAILFFRATTSTAPALLLAAAAANAVTAAWIAVWTVSESRHHASVELRLDAEGTIRVRDAATHEPAACSALFVSAQVLTLSAPGRTIAVWRDAVPADMYRRIAVACRWPRRLPPAQAGDVAGTTAP